MSIERRWIENSLPDQELLDAVAVAFGRISELVSDDHLQLGLQAPVTIHQETGEVYPMGREGRLPCMVGHEDRRAVKISLSDGKVLNLATEMIRARPEDREELESRYGPVRKIFETAGSIEEILLGLFENAKNVTKIDGHHIGIIFLLRSLKVAGVHAFVAEDQAQKYLLMRHIANEAKKIEADAAIHIAEAWTARADPSNPYMRASESKEREEILWGTLVRKDDDPITLTSRMLRDGEALYLEETKKMEGGAPFMFAPLYEAWGKAIPAAWFEQMKQLHSAGEK